MTNATIKILAVTLLLGGCTTTGNVERNAGGGAAIGALAGAVLGNNLGNGDAKKGATIGALAGGALGAVRGYSLDQRRAECQNVRNPELIRDQSGAFYYPVPGTDRTCWAKDQSPR
ncbi:YMGG-like glycine zipper-containing protein [Candidatus Phycosocius spiralis]|uniref:Outer membrane protein n=1 Tax=Candidatus Phycosocius spiralis TaxID=2815099 RepID=A0ABQ4PVJ5_9PROT|nr:YMGG-like glycine zipper-containing protein [Candidatus Phycosocius spiralis]GIU66991.1 outer membrane protein [Candidatus Phycosocius spiralis]